MRRGSSTALLPDMALIDMDDFSSAGLLKYLRTRPLPRLTLAAGFAKFVKLGEGRAQRPLQGIRSISANSPNWCANSAAAASWSPPPTGAANTAIEVLERGAVAVVATTHPFAAQICRKARLAADADRLPEIDRRAILTHPSANSNRSAPSPASGGWYASSTRPPRPCSSAPHLTLAARGPFTEEARRTRAAARARDRRGCHQVVPNTRGGQATYGKIAAGPPPRPS